MPQVTVYAMFSPLMRALCFVTTVLSVGIGLVVGVFSLLAGPVFSVGIFWSGKVMEIDFIA